MPDSRVLAAIVAVGLASYAMRAGGFLAAGAIPPQGLLERLLRRMSHEKYWKPCLNCDLKDRCSRTKDLKLTLGLRHRREGPTESFSVPHALPHGAPSPPSPAPRGMANEGVRAVSRAPGGGLHERRREGAIATESQTDPE